MERLQSLTLTTFPMPPSVNQLYGWSPRAGRLVKTKLCRAYEKAVANWTLMNSGQIEALRSFTKDLGDYVFHVEAMFYMPKGEIVCLNGKPKKNDTSNRIKALHDVLSSLMGVDDCYYWSGTFSKIPVIDTCKPYVNITFKLRTILE